MTKIQKIISLLFSYRTNVFSLVSKPKQTYNYTKFVMQLKYIYMVMKQIKRMQHFQY